MKSRGPIKKISKKVTKDLIQPTEATTEVREVAELWHDSQESARIVNTVPKMMRNWQMLTISLFFHWKKTTGAVDNEEILYGWRDPTIGL